MHHAAATQPTSRRFVWLSGALPIPDPVPRSSGQNRWAGFWFLCVPGLEPIANAMSWLLSRRSYSLRCRLTPPATRTWRLHAVLHVISAIHAQLHTADCICCMLNRISCLISHLCKSRSIGSIWRAPLSFPSSAYRGSASVEAEGGMGVKSD